MKDLRRTASIDDICELSGGVLKPDDFNISLEQCFRNRGCALCPMTVYTGCFTDMQDTSVQRKLDRAWWNTLDKIIEDRVRKETK